MRKMSVAAASSRIQIRKPIFKWSIVKTIGSNCFSFALPELVLWESVSSLLNVSMQPLSASCLIFLLNDQCKKLCRSNFIPIWTVKTFRSKCFILSLPRASLILSLIPASRRKKLPLNSKSSANSNNSNSSLNDLVWLKIALLKNSPENSILLKLILI